MYSVSGTGNETQDEQISRARLEKREGSCAEFIDGGASEVVLIGKTAMILLVLPMSLKLGGELLEKEVDNIGATQAGNQSAQRTF
jgi:hypothetical protein